MHTLLLHRNRPDDWVAGLKCLKGLPGYGVVIIEELARKCVCSSGGEADGEQ